MDLAAQLQLLQDAQGNPALLALATVDLAHLDLSPLERQETKAALLAAAVPHWCDQPFLAVLLAVDEPEAARLLGRLRALRVVEGFPARGEGAVNVHESARLALREHLRLADPDRWRTLALRARAHVSGSSSVHARIEALHHLFALDQDAAAAECEALYREFMVNPEWEQALALSLQELASAGWLESTALVEALLILLHLRINREESPRLEDAEEVVRHAKRVSHPSGLARAQKLLGRIYSRLGRLDDALASYQKGLVIFELLSEADPSNLSWQRDLAASHTNVARVFRSQGRLDDALAFYQKGLVIRESLSEADPSNLSWQRGLAISHAIVARVFRSQGRLDDALASYQKGLVIFERLSEADPSNLSWQRDLAASHTNVARVFRSQGRLDDALAFYQKGLAIRESLSEADPSNLSWQGYLFMANSAIVEIYLRRIQIIEPMMSLQNSLLIQKGPVQSYPGKSGCQSLFSSLNLPRLDYAESSVTLKDRSGQGLHTQIALAISSFIAAILKRLLKRKQKPPR